MGDPNLARFTTMPPPVHALSIAKLFSSLGEREQLYAHHMASWHGTRIILPHTSPEAITIYDWIVSLYHICGGNWNRLGNDLGIEKSEMTAFLDYAACSMSNVGNYYDSGDQKLIPGISEETMNKLCGSHVPAGVEAQIVTVPPYSLGFSDEDSQSTYYLGVRLQRDEIATVSRAMEQHKVLPENMRLRKSRVFMTVAFTYICQDCGFKNVTIANRMAAEGSNLLSSSVVDPSEAEIFQKHKFPACYICVVLHELLGHGIGKMMCQFPDGTYNFNHGKPPADPLTVSRYKSGIWRDTHGRDSLRIWQQTLTNVGWNLWIVVRSLLKTVIGTNLGFPDAWSKDVSHQKQEWATCGIYLPHVNALVHLATKIPSGAQKPDAWAEFLLCCSWCLYEKEQYTYAKKFTQTAGSSFTNKSILVHASAIDHLVLVDLDMGLPQKALTSFETGLSIRQNLLSPTEPFIAFALNNIALAYTEIPDLGKAEQFDSRAISLRLQNNSDRFRNSYSNYAVTLLHIGQADEPERILMQCSSLQGSTDETFLAADNPRFVGDMVLLSRIRRNGGKKDEALGLASKALAWRQKVHGDRFKTYHSTDGVASLLLEQGQIATALDWLDRTTRMAETLDVGEGQAARAEWRASRTLREIGRIEESLRRQEEALALTKNFQPDEQDNVMDEESWERLAPFRLW